MNEKQTSFSSQGKVTSVCLTYLHLLGIVADEQCEKHQSGRTDDTDQANDSRKNTQQQRQADLSFPDDIHDDGTRHHQ